MKITPQLYILLKLNLLFFGLFVNEIDDNLLLILDYQKTILSGGLLSGTYLWGILSSFQSRDTYKLQ